jgi:hypothetical protein
MKSVSPQGVVILVMFTALEAGAVLAQVAPTPTPAPETKPAASVIETSLHSAGRSYGRYITGNFFNGVLGIVSRQMNDDPAILAHYRVEVLRKNRRKQFRWASDRTPYAVHQNTHSFRHRDDWPNEEVIGKRASNMSTQPFRSAEEIR